MIAGLDQPIGIAIAGASARRPGDEPYRLFYAMVRDCVATAVAKARTYDEERKRAEALTELDRAKTDFFSNVSHEFRTPLTLLLGPLEDELRGDGAANERLQMAHRNGLRLLKLVNTLLDFSRIETGRIQAHFEATDLPARTGELASVFRSAIESGGVRLVVECDPLPEPVFVDREMWEKIVLNLLSNAFKFTFEGEIRVGLQRIGDGVVLTVRDTGVGISDGELPKIFDRFHRVRGARARTHEGTGIGLALVRELVQLHGGTVTAGSVEGSGSVMTVTLPTGCSHLPADRIGPSPALDSTAFGAAPFIEEALRWLPSEILTPALNAPPIAPPGTGAERHDGDRPRVVWADDNADMREYVARLLAPHYEIHAVASGSEAITAVRQHDADLVLSDVMMPGMDGFALLRALRQDSASAEVPVILLSARAGEESRVEGMDAGADDYLIKPFSARELVARIDAHVRLSRLRRQTRETLRQAHDELDLKVRERTTALATTNQQLERELEERRAAEARIEALLERLGSVQADERRRIAREIHDQLGQQMTALRMQLQVVDPRQTPSIMAEAIHRANELAETVDRTIDALAWNLRPTALEQLGLVKALETMVQAWSEQFEISASFHAPRSLTFRGSSDVEINLFRIVQEALHNVYKHAGADTVAVRLSKRHSQLVLVIEDNGCGFAPPSGRRIETGGMGLLGMHERAASINATVHIDSTPAAGTSVYVMLPVTVLSRGPESGVGQPSMQGRVSKI